MDLSHCTEDSKLTDTSRCTADDSRYTADNSIITADDSRYTANDSRYTDNDSRCTADDSRYTANDSKYTADDSRYTADDSRYTADDSRYTADDSRCTETSQYTHDDSQETEELNGTDSQINSLNQQSRASTHKASKPECGGNDDRGENLRTLGEKSETPGKVEQTSNLSKFTPKKNVRSVLPGGPGEGPRNKYTPQKVDHRLAQLAVNAYMSPSKREGPEDSRRRGPEEPVNPHTDTDSNTDPTSEPSTSSSNTIPHHGGPTYQTLPQNGNPTNQTIPLTRGTIQQDLDSQSQNQTDLGRVRSGGEHHPSATLNRTVSTNPAHNSQLNAQQKTLMSHPASQYSQDMSQLCSNMQQNKEGVGPEDWSIPQEDEEEEGEDMDETCDLSKMEDEMETSQVEEPAHPQTMEVHCAACNNWFMTMNSYTLHMAKHAQMSSPLLGLECEICKKSYLYEMEFKAHVQAHLEKQKCRVCSKPFAEKSELQRHVKIHQDKKEFSCHFCGKEFHYTFNLKKHLRTHTGEKPYTCILCELKFTHKNSLNRHMSLHTNEMEVECCVCNKVCPDRWTLQKHLASHQILQCSQCDQSYSNSRQLQEHQKTHQRAGTSAQSLPPIQGGNQGQLGGTPQVNTENVRKDEEMKQEPNQKPKAKRVRRSIETQCEICRKVFKNLGNYYRHLQSKEGMPVQTCDLCGHQFHDVYDLLKHTRQVHSQSTETKGYSCRVCAQNFPDLTLLTEHMSEHLQSMKKSSLPSERNPSKSESPLPLFCSICGKQFVNSVLLDLHMMEHSSSRKSSENILDLSKSKEAGQPPPRKRLKLEDVDMAESQEYYDSDKENEPLNLSKKKCSPRVKPRILGVHQPRGVPSVPSVSLAPTHPPLNFSHRPASTPDTGPVGLDLTTRSNKITAEEPVHKEDKNLMVCNKEKKKFAKGDSHEDNPEPHYEVRSTPLKPPTAETSVTMETHDNSLEDKNVSPDQTSDPCSKTGSPSSLTCEYCTKAFSDPVTLNRHLSSHYKEWAFYCNYCNTMFTEEVSYRAHTPIHPSHTPYMCNVCSDHFSDRISLQAHISQDHPQDKPFQCGVCQRRFPVKSYLGSHCRTHLTERPFKCNICERTFVHNFNLTKHMRTHTGEKPYTCAWCDRKFSQKNSLNR